MTPTEAAEAVAIYGGIRPAARALGVSRSTLCDRMHGKPERKSAGRSPDNVLEFPALPDKREPIDKLLKRRLESYERLSQHRAAATWQRVEVHDKKPIALCFVGDPHLDDDGCNWRALCTDIAYLRDTPGMYAINIGDTTNNWVGRLARLFGNQETSQTSARQLAEWFLLHAGIRWAAVILGNHDEWNEGGEIIQRMVAISKAHIPVHTWAAKLEFAFPNGAVCRVSAAHDFKGRSIYNAAHGLKREAIWNQDGAHILAAGHIHFGEIGQCELPGGHNPWLIRVRGYKEHDSHALVNGYHEGQRFQTVCAIIDPNAPEGERVSVFATPRQAAAVLRTLRGDEPPAASNEAKNVDRSMRPRGRGKKPSRKNSRGKAASARASVRRSPKANDRSARR